MTVQLEIPYETLVKLVGQLSKQQQLDLISKVQGAMLLEGLSADEKLAMLRAVQFDIQVAQEPSDSREDWYDTDGR